MDPSQNENFDDLQSSSSRHVLEFRISQISGSFDIDTIANAIEHDLCSSGSDIIKIDFNQIRGVVKYPERWTQKILVYLDSEQSKNDLLVRGLTLYNQHIELSELGLGPIKVMIQNADLYFPDDVIKQWVSQYGDITGFKHETHKLRNKGSKWYTGNRIVWVKNVQQSIPPVAKLSSGEETVNISVWHYGQTEIKCRFCHSIVPKGHICGRAPPKKCFSCGGNDHIKANCPLNSYDANFPSMSIPASGASQDHVNKGKTPLKVINPNMPLDRSPRAGSPSEGNHQAKRQRRNSSPGLSFYGNPDNSESPSGRSNVKRSCEVAFFTDDISEEMDLKGDDVLKINTTMPVEDTMKISTAVEMLDNMSPERKQEIEVAVLHVGTEHFPTKSKHEFDTICADYENLVHKVMDECPKSSIVLSSVLPRAGDDAYKVAINSCISEFNGKLDTLSKANERNKSRLHFVDNAIHYKDETGSIIRGMYIDPDGEGKQINDEGHNRLTSGIIDAIKSVFYQDKLVDAQNFSMDVDHAHPNI